MKCEIIKDMLPLYVDGICSIETSELIEKHLETCESCKIELKSMKSGITLDAKAIEDNMKAKKPFKKIERKNMYLYIGIISIVSLVVISIITLTLWSSGVFSVIDKQISPDGLTTVTVYDKDVRGIFPEDIPYAIPKDVGFMMEFTGAINGNVSYGGYDFEYLEWSPCSDYIIFSVFYEDERYLKLDDIQGGGIAELNWYINMSMNYRDEFTSIMSSESWETLELNFIEWIDANANMKVSFEFTDKQGTLQNGTMIYNCETGVITEIEFN